MLEQLVDTLLYEGYALYPYTPGATKNATPTPFGIVYPPVYAAGSGATFDHLQIECVAEIGRARARGRGPLPAGERRAPQGAGARGSSCRATRSGEAQHGAPSTSTGCAGTRSSPRSAPAAPGRG